VRFFVGGGTRNEVFEEYLQLLIPKLSRKYKNKKLVIVLDNLAAHKSSLIVKVMKKFPNAKLLLIPSRTP